ncbi:MAG: hypothetical protein IPI48_10995 [bacterium]|nr:hypothetical protein [bacterium]
MPVRVRTGALTGIAGLPVSVEVVINRGLPGYHLVGLPGTEVRESRERVLSALRHGGVRVPPGRITVNLAPAGVRRRGIVRPGDRAGHRRRGRGLVGRRRRGSAIAVGLPG